MRILFVLSQIEVTGAETYALTLASSLRDLGHEIVLVSEKLKDTHHFKFYSLPLHSENSSTLGRIRNILALKKILKCEKIDLIHSHSRAANLVSFFASGRKIPMTVTVHGRWRNHFAARWLPCLGDSTIAICPYLKKYLIENLRIPEKQITMVPNGIDTEIFAPALSNKVEKKQLLYIGRFNSQKKKVILFLLRLVFPKILKKFPEIFVKMVGLSSSPEVSKEAMNLNLVFQKEVIKIVEPENGSKNPTDEKKNLLNLYQEATVVIGSGRVALEGMSCGKPIVAIGESSAPGLITEETFQNAFDSNFGDCGEWNLFEKENNLVADLEKVLTNKALKNSLSVFGRDLILKQFDSRKIASQVEKVYRELIQ